MGFISKVELKKQLKEMGIKVEGEYVKKSEIEKVLATVVDKTRSGKTPVGNFTYIFKPSDGNLDFIVRSAEARKGKLKAIKHKDAVHVTGDAFTLQKLVDSFKQVQWDGEITEQ